MIAPFVVLLRCDLTCKNALSSLLRQFIYDNERLLTFALRKLCKKFGEFPISLEAVSLEKHTHAWTSGWSIIDVGLRSMSRESPSKEREIISPSI